VAESVFLAELPDPPPISIDESFNAQWDLLLKIRGEVTKALELARKEKRIGLALDAKVLIRPPEDMTDFLEGHSELLRTITIVSQLDLSGELDSGDNTVWQSDVIEGLAIKVIRAAGEKCARCWTWSEDVGKDPSWPDVCSRCSRVLSDLVIE
jgi:isoleucyl-tRNA synthetase